MRFAPQSRSLLRASGRWQLSTAQQSEREFPNTFDVNRRLPTPSAGQPGHSTVIALRLDSNEACTGPIRRPHTPAKPVQRSASGAVPLAEDSEIVSAALLTPGYPPAPSTRSFFESQFHHDFSQVRVHIGELASQSAQAINALAYTSDVVFANGEFAPTTRSGQRLLTHELMHVLQQNAAGPSSAAGVFSPAVRPLPAASASPSRIFRSTDDKKTAKSSKVSHQHRSDRSPGHSAFPQPGLSDRRIWRRRSRNHSTGKGHISFTTGTSRCHVGVGLPRRQERKGSGNSQDRMGHRPEWFHGDGEKQVRYRRTHLWHARQPWQRSTQQRAEGLLRPRQVQLELRRKL